MPTHTPHNFEEEKRAVLADVKASLGLLDDILRSPFAEQMFSINELRATLVRMQERVCNLEKPS
jgi:hypothetical protein